LILVSCTVSSFVTMANAKKIAEAESEDTVSGDTHEEENILLALNDMEMVEKMVNLSMLIKGKQNTDGVFGLNIINEEKNESSVKNAEKLLDAAVNNAASMDVQLTPITRYDSDLVNGIKNVIKEQRITDLIIGVDSEKGFTTSLIYNIFNGYVHNTQSNLLIYHAVQPISTIKRHLVFIPRNAETQAGFFYALLRVWNIARNSGAVMEFYAFASTVKVLEKILQKANIEATIETINSWKEIERISKDIEYNEGLIMLMDRREIGRSRFTNILPDTLNKQFSDINYLIIYPFTEKDEDVLEKRSINNFSDYTEI